MSKAKDEKRLFVANPGPITGLGEGWWVSPSVIKNHPELKTVLDIIERPDLFPHPEDSSKGGMMTCPAGWNCQLSTNNLFRAFKMKKKCLIVVANYYENISNNLLQSALRSIKNKLSFKIIYVPGVFEIPITISKNLRKYDGFIALGCVIKGQTPHFEFISSSVTDNILNMSVKNKKPIGNGIITCLNKKQAIARSKKGAEAANAMLSVLSQ